MESNMEPNRKAINTSDKETNIEACINKNGEDHNETQVPIRPAFSEEDYRRFVEKKSESDENRLKIGRILLLPTMLLALFVAFLEYDVYSFMGANHCGIVTVLITVATIVYFAVVMKLLGKKIKPTNILYMIALSLLALATFLSADEFMATINKYAIIALTLNLLINGFVEDGAWGILEHVKAWFEAAFGGFTKLEAPIKDFLVVRKSVITTKGKSDAMKVGIGLLISIPLLFIIITLLCSADAVFADAFENLIPDFRFSKIVSFTFIFTFVFFLVYCVSRFILSKNFRIEPTSIKRCSPIIAITVGILISIVYGAFSVIQFVYLFGKHTLPAGYTYASYAKEGVFQLMWLSIINLVIVICGIAFFEKNNLLKFLLTFISACTYLMIGSSSYRLWQYVNIYHGLTRKRIWGIWGLITVALCFVGVIIYIYRDSFKLYRFGLVTILATYISLALLKPDYLVAKVNLDVLPALIEAECDYDLLDRLGLDACPVMIKYDDEWINNRHFYEYEKYNKESVMVFDWKYLNISDLYGRFMYKPE